MDEHVPKAVTEGLRRRGVDVITVQELGLQSAEEMRHLERAAQGGRVVVTQDANFYGCMHPASCIKELRTRINTHRCPTFYDPSYYSTMYCPPATWFAMSNFSDLLSLFEHMFSSLQGCAAHSTNGDDHWTIH